MIGHHVKCTDSDREDVSPGRGYLVFQQPHDLNVRKRVWNDKTGLYMAWVRGPMLCSMGHDVCLPALILKTPPDILHFDWENIDHQRSTVINC